MMADHVAALKALLADTTAALPPGVEIAVKRFFNGAAAYANQRICITLTPAGLAMKLPEDGRARLLAQGGKPLRYFPKAPIKKQYVVVPEGIADDGEQLRFWARQSIDYALTLPPPKRKSCPTRS
jgi:TfoX/Sxy family transcriptional regulator of competence genes